MQNRGRVPGHARYEFPGAGSAHTQNFDAAVPGAHDLGWFQAVMVHLRGMRFVEAAADLSTDIKKVPDREAFFSGEHGCDAVALHILHRDAELTFDLACAVDRRDIRAGQTLSTLRLFLQRLLQGRGAVPESTKLNRF